ncbi:lipoprotein insertase outer membrane protein LolB [Shewanella atlantica]|uniref:Outer-membrane lipoprotein LolB n=1 Tax=Shewanella atlantica TaxID=271099 RepID=A0A3S0L462_9GAMM|nr:lipoprotein insertase outer membrane protein LolB [Shewanella atlantica]RTR26645.1 outer membrane lipoprotein LolB [Shewanella atlantica]
MNNLSYLTKIPLIWVLLSVTLLSACSVTPPENFIPVQVDDVSNAQAWEMQGKLAVRTSKDKFSTNLYWFHTDKKNELKLTTMLGTTVLSLTTLEGEARLEVDGKVYQDRDAQRLLTRVTGWSIPVDALPLWITGRVSDDDELLVQDEHLRPIKLTTQNPPPWEVEFISWQQQSGAELPRLLQLKREDLRLKIQISQWQALSTAHLLPSNQPEERLNDQ